MRILYVNSHLSRLDSEAGTWGRLLVRELRKAGAEVATFPAQPLEGAPLRGGGGRALGTLKRRLGGYLRRDQALFLVEYYLFARGMARNVLNVWRVWRRRRELRCDVVLARTHEYEWGPLLISRMLKRPLVLEVHAPFYVERQLRGHGYSRLLRWFERVQWRHAAHIWVFSARVKALLSDGDVPPARIKVIAHGIRLDQFDRSGPRRIGRGARIVFVGSFYPWHGVDALLEAFAKARERVGDLRLCLIGDGIARSECERKAASLNVAEAVEFTGWLPLEQVVARLHDSDIGVAPYLWLDEFYFEPVKILEYMAAGLVTVASEQGLIGDMLQHGKCGTLVPPEDVPALADALVDLALNPDERKALGQAARARIAEHYAWTTTARRVLSLCEDAAAGRA